MAPGTAHRPWISLLMAAVLITTGIWLIITRHERRPPVELADPSAVYDPIGAGEALPSGYRVGLPRDQIAPVYQPSFTAAGNVDWPDDSLVIGVAGEESAKAYPVTHLNSREMVVDSLNGIPILVTW